MDGRNDQAALTYQWGAINSYSDTEPNIGADDMLFNIIYIIGLKSRLSGHPPAEPLSPF